ncbi:acyltransferase family protein [Tardiphaga robiniae]|jgi:peptidoglycan/LPS O-acetylase OafA/YrhL|uniref:acyltransferase family protein n=1 Tax=Tardiphaga TaxID=1395974 RepID=UPI002855A745|nr:acyltransferase [Tardiphaga robiniae]MDR6661108.1 peptidoglycan/LPS O-acetylase OafA/YrhL [Tardiphaga robiniae]
MTSTAVEPKHSSAAQGKIEMQISGIQTLRGIAAVLIVTYHATAHPMLTSIGQIGILQAGVDLFFVISGFVMWITTENRNYQTAWQFWRLRIARVVPLYWAATLAYMAVAILLPSQLFSAAMSPWAVLSSFLFIPSWHLNGEIVPIYTLGWTLNYEMYFYFVFGLCLLAKTRSARLVSFATFIIASVAFGIATDPATAIGKLYTNPMIIEFLAGVTIGALFNRFRPSFYSPAVGIVLLLLAIAVIGSTTIVSLPRVIGYGLPAAFSVMATLLIERPSRKHSLKIGTLLGDASYSIYLAHPFVLRPFFLAATVLLAAPTTGIQWTLVAGATTTGILGGLACYYLVETPLTSMARRLLGRNDTTTATDHLIRRR